MKKVLSLFFTVLLFVSISKAQTADVTITLNEQFFDVLLDAVFTNLKQPSFPLAGIQTDNSEMAFAGESKFQFLQAKYDQIPDPKSQILNCDESIRLHREIDGVRTAVRFREGKIFAPIAFSGSYNPPLIGCIDFQGWAEASIELEFDQTTQTLVGRATVLDVNLSGTRGIGSSLIARLVQSSIDSKINPIKILDLEKVSFVVPVQNSGSLRMKATAINQNIGDGTLNVHITYQFLKG